MVPSRAEWRGETHNRATTPVGYCPSMASFSVRPYCKNARRDRCQEYHNCFPFGELEETTRTSLNYVNEDYPARPEIKQSLPGWGDNCGSESSTLETDVCVWRYAPLVVFATQEEEEEEYTSVFIHPSSVLLLQTLEEIMQWLLCVGSITRVVDGCEGNSLVRHTLDFAGDICRESSCLIFVLSYLCPEHLQAGKLAQLPS